LLLSTLLVCELVEDTCCEDSDELEALDDVEQDGLDAALSHEEPFGEAPEVSATSARTSAVSAWASCCPSCSPAAF
jgi:hypothetical protein